MSIFAEIKKHMKPVAPEIKTIARIADRRGNLSFIENDNPLPFAMERVYRINDVPGGACRYGRALRTQWEAVIALTGSLTVRTVSHNDGMRSFRLTNPDEALLLPPMTWREMTDFTTNAAALVIASGPFSESEYIREFPDFEKMTGNE